MPTGKFAGEPEMINNTELVPPASLMFVGNGDFKEIGEHFKQIFIDQGALKPHERVLDVGCGVGRMAIPLTPYQVPPGEYAGFDIVKEGIVWCQQEITPRFPNFKFQFVDVYNGQYNPGGKLAAGTFRFPYASDYFDFAFLTSVFTHMLPADLEHYLSEVWRVLKPGGRCLATFFLLNSESRFLLQAGSSSVPFEAGTEEHATVPTQVPEYAIAFNETLVKELYKRQGFELNESVFYGSWCGRSMSLSYQDIVVATKVS